MTTKPPSAKGLPAGASQDTRAEKLPQGRKTGCCGRSDTHQVSVLWFLSSPSLLEYEQPMNKTQLLYSIIRHLGAPHWSRPNGLLGRMQHLRPGVSINSVFGGSSWGLRFLIFLITGRLSWNVQLEYQLPLSTSGIFRKKNTSYQLRLKNTAETHLVEGATQHLSHFHIGCPLLYRAEVLYLASNSGHDALAMAMAWPWASNLRLGRQDGIFGGQAAAVQEIVLGASNQRCAGIPTAYWAGWWLT